MNSSEDKGRLYYGWVVLVACLMIVVIASGLRFSFGVFFKSLSTDFGLSRAVTSEVFSVYMILSALAMIIAGWALDKYKPRLVFLVMGFFAGLSLLLTSFASELWHIFISYSFLLAIGTGAVYIQSISVALKWFANNRGVAAGIVASGMGAGIMIITPVSAWLIASHGWQVSYRILALVAFVVMIPSALLLKWDTDRAVTFPSKSGIDTAKSGSLKSFTQIESTDFTLYQAARTRNFWSVALVRFLAAICAYIVFTHVVLHVIDLGISPVKSSSVLSLIGGTIVIGMLVMGRVSDVIGRKKTILICLMLTSGAMLWLIWSSHLWMLYVFAVVIGFSQGGLAPPLNALIGDTFGMRHIGVIMGVLNTPWGIGAA
ncbi:MFS transporter, partial [Chloroflexota bacterium]